MCAILVWLESHQRMFWVELSRNCLRNQNAIWSKSLQSLVQIHHHWLGQGPVTWLSLLQAKSWCNWRLQLDVYLKSHCSQWNDNFSSSFGLQYFSTLFSFKNSKKKIEIKSIINLVGKVTPLHLSIFYLFKGLITIRIQFSNSLFSTLLTKVYKILYAF